MSLLQQYQSYEKSQRDIAKNFNQSKIAENCISDWNKEHQSKDQRFNSRGPGPTAPKDLNKI